MLFNINKLLINDKIKFTFTRKLLAVKKLYASSKLNEIKAENMSHKGNEIVWMDLEMTGLDVLQDKILEVACLITDQHLNILVEGPCFAINQPPEVLDNMNDWCKKHHTESGLVEKCLNSEITTARGEQILLEFLKKHIPKGKCPLAGNSVYMDRLFLRQQMPGVDEYLHYRIIDVSTIKELALRWQPVALDGAPVKKLVHRSLDDIKESIAELKYYKESFFKF